MKPAYGEGDPLEIAYDDTPPREGPEIFIMRLKANEMHVFTIFSHSLAGIWTHWTGSKSEPHFKDPDKCPGCQKKKTKRWKGFLHVYCHSKAQEVFLELTPHSAQSLLNQLAGGKSMRGNRIQVKRGKGDNGRLTISILTATGNPETMPEPKDPRPSILKLWGMMESEPSGWIEQEEEIRQPGSAPA